MTLDSNTQSINCCTSFVDIVSPTEAEILTYNSEKTKVFYNLFTGAIIPIMVKYSGVIRKFVGEGLESYFPQSSNPSNVNAMRDVLECCLELVERQKSLSLEMNRKGLSDISYKVGIDYETLILRGYLILDKPPVWCSAYEICTKTPTSIRTVVLGEDLHNIIINLPELQNRYSFEHMGEYMIEEKKKGYSVYSVSGKG